jgi:hypothetical protein
VPRVARAKAREAEIKTLNPTVTPKHTLLSDRAPAAGAQRQRAFADAVKNGHLIALDHMYFPGIGRLRKEKVGYRWISAPYINDSQKP